MSRSKIIKPTPSDIPAGPVENQGEHQGRRRARRRSIAAVIRPVPSGSNLEGSLRIDPAPEHTVKEHQRNHDLDDYVNWLREKIDRARLTATAEDILNSRPARMNPHLKPHFSSPKKGTNEVTESAIESTHSEQLIDPADLPEPEIVLVDQDKVIEEEIRAHQRGILPASNQELSNDPPPVSDLSTVVTTMDVGDSLPSSITDTPAQSTGMTDDELARQISEAIDSARIAALEKQKAETEALLKMKSLRVDSGHQANVLLHTNIKDIESLDTKEETEATTDPTTPTRQKLSAEESEEFISKISKAIASVLTDRPEAAFEEDVRQHFVSELHAHTKGESPIVLTDRPQPGAETASGDVVIAQTVDQPAMAIPVELDQVTDSVLKNARKSVPTTVAAWDVEDFRWPTVSNRMIVSGGQAMEGLYQATMNMTTPTAQRIAVSGLHRGAGTSSIAVSLARWAAACGNTVLLIDADISQPELSSQVGLAPNLSWIKAGTDSLPVAEVIVRAQKSNLCIMPMAPLASRAAWPRYIYDNLGSVLGQVQDHFDLVLIDVGPATQLMDELSNSKLLVDGILFVHDGVDSPKFRKTKTGLASFGLDRMVVTQNRVRQRTANVA